MCYYEDLKQPLINADTFGLANPIVNIIISLILNEQKKSNDNNFARRTIVNPTVTLLLLSSLQLNEQI